MKQVICMKWGSRYGAEYVNRLYNMVRRNVTGDLHFVCLTDESGGIRKEVRCLPCPEVPLSDARRNLPWRKISLWQPRLYDLEGEFLYLDLDVVIVDTIDRFFSWGEDFCVMRNWNQPRKRIGNTSVYRFRVGSHPYLWTRFVEEGDRLPATFRNSQTYVSETIERMTFWPDPWCALFKIHCVPRSVPLRWFRTPSYPEGTKIVAFPGVPNPPDAAAGRWPCKWHKKFYKHIRPAHWVAEHWR